MTNSPSDYPRGLTVSLSPDGKNWTTAATLTEAECAPKDGVLEIKLAPGKSKYVKMVQTGRSETNYWSIHEMYVYE